MSIERKGIFEMKPIYTETVETRINPIMPVKIKVLLFILLSVSSFAFSQQLKETKFQEAVNNVLNYYNEKDTEKINSLINKDIGIFLLGRIGANPRIGNLKGLCLSTTDACYSNDNYNMDISTSYMLQSQKFLEFPRLQYAELPSIDCEKASKKGLYTDTLQIDKLLTDLLKEEIKVNYYQLDRKVLKKYLKTASEIEYKTRKVVLVADYVDAEYYGIFIFYLTYIKNDWYLTIVDFMTTDCSV